MEQALSGMLLSSSTYFIFLTVLFFLYWPLSRWRAAALAVILFGNYFFYAKWDLFYLGLIPIVSTCDYTLALLMDRTKIQGLRRFYVTVSVLLNLGMLAAFKYAPFALDNWSKLSGQPAPAWQWTFPLGISFYVFQALTYTIDVFRKDANPTQSYLTYLAAVSFFPTTLAGPITRVSSLITQLEKKDKGLIPTDGGRALFLIGCGLMKKFLIADYLAENLVNRVFDFPKLYTGAETLIATYGYAFQLYFDFSGYTDIALGSALLLGIKLPQNFNAPYSAHNLSDFWRRWHISLSNWLRDYLYFSLPGQRSKVMPYFNLVITMALGGLWHGPSWNFVVWGLLHGIGQVIVRLWQIKFGPKPAESPFWRFLSIVLTFHYVCFCWIFFRASTWQGAMDVLERIGSLSASFSNISLPLAIVLTIGIFAHYMPKKWYDFTTELYVKSPFFVQAAAMVALVIAIQYIATTGSAPFIYVNF
jgi:D-alanyl-lipoteichoic acid acyltransferase DltB (MBOAT superfamily)